MKTFSHVRFIASGSLFVCQPKEESDVQKCATRVRKMTTTCRQSGAMPKSDLPPSDPESCVQSVAARPSLPEQNSAAKRPGRSGTDARRCRNGCPTSSGAILRKRSSGLEPDYSLQQGRRLSLNRTAAHFDDVANHLRRRHDEAPRKSPPTEQPRKCNRPKLPFRRARFARQRRA